MKTIILSIATLLFFTLTTSTQGQAATKNNGVETVLTNVSNFSGIEVHGNVEVYVSTGENNVKVYDSYYNQNALVQEQNGVLRISSYKTEKLVVWVTVNNLTSLTAYDNATVKSFGKLSAVELNVNLNDHASAQLDLDASVAKITLNGNAKAKLAGYSDESNIELSQMARLNTTKFEGTKTVKRQAAVVTIAKLQNDELAEIE
jgi:hypothetical protein